MPTVSINRNQLYKALGKQYTDAEFDELCFQFGIEVDEIVDDPEKGITLKIEVGANRYDLLCIEGIGLALNTFLGRCSLPNYKILTPKNKSECLIVVNKGPSTVRPYVVGAVLRNLSFTQEIYDSFIDLQDKLHRNIARKRTLVAIGTHDLDTVQGPFSYDAEPPNEIEFVSLNRSEKMRADHLLDVLSEDLHLREYVPIIKDKPLYPVIRDRNGVVLSLPPIINGDHSKITLRTKNVFIECTATDLFKAQIVLDTVVCMFSQYCKDPFTVEPVDVEYPNGDKFTYPVLESRTVETSVEYCNKLVGVDEDGKSIASLLSKMGLETKWSPSDSSKLSVTVPPTRYDILHECDIAEDFGIAYGFDKLASDMKMPSTNTIGQEFPLNYLSDKIRLLMSQNSYSEAATFSLCSIADIGEKLRVDLSKEQWVKVGNPKTVDCEAVRNSLLPGLLRSLASNKHVPLPIKMFEVGDIVLKDQSIERTRGVGARNERHLCAVYCNVRGGVELVQGVLDNIMGAFKILHVDEDKNGYYLKEDNHPSYFAGWCGSIMIGDVNVGRIGLIHPEVLNNFSLSTPVSAFNLNLETVLKFSKI